MHNMACVKGIISLTEGFKRIAGITGTITCPSDFISSPLHNVTWLYGLLTRPEQGYGDIIAQS